MQYVNHLLFQRVPVQSFNLSSDRPSIRLRVDATRAFRALALTHTLTRASVMAQNLRDQGGLAEIARKLAVRIVVVVSP